MLRRYIFLIAIFFNNSFQAQEIEKATDSKNTPLTLINAFVNSTYKGNAITDFSSYGIDTKKVGKYSVILKILKHKNFKENRDYFLNNKLNDTIIFNKSTRKFKGTPAKNIIKKVIKNRKKNQRRISSYSVNFYSKNTYHIQNAPKGIMGIDLGDFGGSLDSTRSGTIYLSETLSKISKKKKQFKEHVLAVKVNGLDTEIGFNRGVNTNFNFYNNQVTLGDKIVSPIAKLAFKYYKYKLVKTFKEKDFTIYKIKVIPKRKIGNVFNGYIYIVANYWQLYAIDLYVKGKQIQQPVIDYIKIKQLFSFNKTENSWILKEQESSFKFDEFDIHLKGKLRASYANYNFNPKNLKNQQNKNLFSIADNFESKSDLFWKESRAFPLKKQEKLEYKKKVKIHKKRTSKPYLDSVNKIQNKFKFSDILFDYNYRNLYKNSRFKISFPINTMYNTVQGWHSKTAISYFKDKKHQNYSIKAAFDYGFSDKQFRATGHFNYRFNDKVNSILKFNFGRQLTEFNAPYSTAPIFNTLSSLFFERNDSKFYDRNFAEINYHQELLNGLYLTTNISYEDRKPVFNRDSFTLFNWKDVSYSSNNPLHPSDFDHAVIEEQKIFRFSTNATILFGQKYLLMPYKKVNLPTHYPKLSITYTKGFLANKKKQNYDFIEARVFQNFNISNKGLFSYNIKGGDFINKKELSFIDYKHFDITQVHVSIVKEYSNYFALLEPYAFSTKNKYAELHIEHHFNGYVLRKIPLINKLQFKLIVGANTLFTKEHKPYSEINIGLNNVGFGKYRFLRIDYVRAFIGGKSTGSFIFGLSL